MLRLQTRQLYNTAIGRAAAPTRGKAQGFAKKNGNAAAKYTAKKITPGTLYKKWSPTMATSKLKQNAIPVETPVFKPTNISSTINQVSSFSNKQYQLLYRLGSFKQNQFNELFPRPVALVREKTTKKLFDLLKTSSNKKFILTGESGVGKSVLLAQLHALALEEKGIIITISQPDLFLNGRNDFFYDDKQYVQPMYLKKLLTKILKSNDPEILASIPLTKDYKFSNASPKDSAIKKFVTLSRSKNSLLDLVSVNTTPRNRGELFESVICELSAQSKAPVFFTVDNFSRILTGPFSAYKDVENKSIHVLELQIAKTIMSIVDGTIKFPHKQSSVVLATSGVDRTNRTLPIGLGKMAHDPYITRYHYEPVLAEQLLKGGVQEFEVAKLDKEEVKQLLEFYLKSEIVLDRDAQEKTLEQLVDEKYCLSGNGNPRELLKSIILQYS